MAGQFVLSDCTSELMAHAIYDELEDETFSGRIPDCMSVLAFGATLRAAAVTRAQMVTGA